MTAVPISIADKPIGVLTIGVDAERMEDAKKITWTSYMQLLSASMSGMIKDNRQVEGHHHGSSFSSLPLVLLLFILIRRGDSSSILLVIASTTFVTSSS